MRPTRRSIGLPRSLRFASALVLLSLMLLPAAASDAGPPMGLPVTELFPGAEFDPGVPAQARLFGFQPGERVLGFYEGEWYECTVSADTGGGVSVAWDDGTASMVHYDDVMAVGDPLAQPGVLRPGDRVMARFGDAFYEATLGIK